jgi:hypothetical protein
MTTFAHTEPLQECERDARAKPLVRAAAALSWLLPGGTLVLFGIAEKAGSILPLARVPAHVLTGACFAIAALGITLAGCALRAKSGDRVTRRRAILGMAASAVVLGVVAVASISGAVMGRHTQADLKRMTDLALNDAPGWNGGAALDGASVFAFEIDAASDLAKLLARAYDRPYRIVLFGVDNRAGGRDVLLDLGSARLHHTGGAVTMTAAAVPPESVRVATGERIDGARAPFAPSDSLRDVDWIEIRFDGVERRLPGRYFTREEKRAIEDASRAR